MTNETEQATEAVNGGYVRQALEKRFSMAIASQIMKWVRIGMKED